MELSHSLVSAITKPTFLFSRSQFVEHSHSSITTASASWDSSLLNPKNRIDSLDIAGSGWRIDGATMCGRQFYAVPISLLPSLIPLRIDVFIPDQEQHPWDLRGALDSGFSVCMRHPRLANLGISRHLCRALDHHCLQNPGFLQSYQTLPFGSKLVFENVTADVAAMTLTTFPAHDLERHLLSASSLQKLWEPDVPKHSWPEVIDLRCLRLKRQLHDSISVVSIRAENRCLSEKDLVFKSSNTDPKFIYHELKFLLTSPRHVNIMDPPLYIVTKKCNFGGKHGVCGFILPYYPTGSIRDMLPSRLLSGTLTSKQQLIWARQIVSALIHVGEAAGTFYSDLRPDNVLLTESEPGGDQNIVLCDFEQRGNWHEWCAPEILYAMYANNLYAYSSANQAHPSRCACNGDNTNSHHPNHWYSNVISRVSKAGPHGSNPAWFSLSPHAQEKAQVYSLGLFLYCIFEGVSNLKVSLANAWPYEPHVEFPEFQRTPPIIRDCIRRCTVDAPEWRFEDERDPTTRGIQYHPAQERVVRINGKLYPGPAGRPDITDRGAQGNIANGVLKTATNWWESEIQSAKSFFESENLLTGQVGSKRPTLREVQAMLDHIEVV